MPPAARSVEDLFPLIEFCKNGNLKAISDWMQKATRSICRPARKPEERARSRFAIVKDFLTLTEVLVDAGADPSSRRFAINWRKKHQV